MEVVVLILALLATTLGFSHAAGQELSIFETAAAVIAPWEQGEKAAGSDILDLHIVLNQPRELEFEQHVMNIATPGHAHYGEFMSKDDIKEYLRPSGDVIQAVEGWLQANAVQPKENYRLMHNHDIVNLRITVSKAEDLFDTRFYHFTNAKGRKITRALEYFLPGDLHEHVKTVMPIIRFPIMLPQISMIIEEEDLLDAPPDFGYDPVYCNRTIVPSCIQGLYQLNNFTAPYNTGTMIDISGFLNQTADVDSLHSFIAMYAPYFPQVFPTLVTTDGSTLRDPHQFSSYYTSETSLDLQYSSAIAAGIPVTFYSTDGLVEGIRDLDQPMNIVNEPYLKQLTYLLSLPDDKLPTVLSTSYGENEQTVPYSYANATCNLFAQLGARGVSVIFSSGDSGPGSACQRNDGTNATRFDPIFPASCPFVTSVGGTQFVEPEVAISFSSGGFSDYFPRPAYQSSAVQSYLDDFMTANPNAPLWANYYSHNGRGFPDVSAQSFNFITMDHMQTKRVSGTSASAPLFAGIIANLNALRTSRGLPKLGFLNPWLYSDGMGGFSDITKGGSKGCTGRSIYSDVNTTYVPYASWNATRGWDPVTGIGTPMWPRLVELGLKGADVYPDLGTASDFNVTNAGTFLNSTATPAAGNDPEGSSPASSIRTGKWWRRGPWRGARRAPGQANSKAEVGGEEWNNRP